MHTDRHQGKRLSRLRRSRVLLATIAIIGLVATGCSDSVGGETTRPAAGEAAATTSSTANSTAAPASTAVPGSTATPTSTFTPAPTPVPGPTVSPEVRAAARDIAQAPLGTFVVAKPDAGIATNRPSPLSDGTRAFEIPVYDGPYGAQRVLLYENDIDGVQERHPLLHWGEAGPPLVLRVVAGDADDAWIQVQSPSRPHDRVVWVQSADFDFEFTPQRIEIDLAGPGRLRLIDGGTILIDAPIVQGRPGRATPTHITFIDGGVAQAALGVPAYGSYRLSMASFSEVLGTFGAGGAPRNYLHGTNRPDLMGQALSSGEIRVTDEVIEQIGGTIVPGTPVLIFDSSKPDATLEAITTRAMRPAATVELAEIVLDVTRAVELVEPQLWQRCAVDAGTVCRVAPTAIEPLTPVGSVFLTAQPVAPELVGIGDVVPVYDQPGGPKRMLEDHNAIDRTDVAVPLYNPTAFDHPLVLRVVRGAPGDEWILVQAPIRPARSSVWVRADDFTFDQTTKRIEIDIAGEGRLTVFDGANELLTSAIVSGRESRPTTLNDTYIEQVFEGAMLSPAYGSYVLTLASFSEVLGTFGGGGLPGQSLHGTNQPELVGQRVSSGGIRVPNEVIERIAAEPDIVGAHVTLFDSTGTDYDTALERQRSQPWVPATTVPFAQVPLPAQLLIAYS